MGTKVNVFLLIVVAALLLTGCGSTPAPKADPVEFDKQMKDLNEEVLRQEGKIKLANPRHP